MGNIFVKSSSSEEKKTTVICKNAEKYHSALSNLEERINKLIYQIPDYSYYIKNQAKINSEVTNIEIIFIGIKNALLIIDINEDQRNLLINKLHLLSSRLNGWKSELLAAKASELPNSLSNPSFLTLLRPRLSILR